MKRFIYALLIIGIANACSSISVTSDYDKTVDFSKYKTFMYYGWGKKSDQILTDFDKNRIEGSFQAEFAKRGWTVTKGNGDAVVSLYIVVDKRTSYSSYTNHYNSGMYGGMYGSRYGYGYGYGYGMPMNSTTTTVRNDYLEGTLIVDVFDTKERKHIWQGIGKKTINENTSNREARIQEAVAAIMSQFPVQPKN